MTQILLIRDYTPQSILDRHVSPIRVKQIHSLELRWEIDGLQDRHSQLASCLYFLKQEMGGLQDGHLQPAIYLYFKRE